MGRLFVNMLILFHQIIVSIPLIILILCITLELVIQAWPVRIEWNLFYNRVVIRSRVYNGIIVYFIVFILQKVFLSVMHQVLTSFPVINWIQITVIVAH